MYKLLSLHDELTQDNKGCYTALPLVLLCPPCAEDSAARHSGSQCSQDPEVHLSGELVIEPHQPLLPLLPP